MNGRPIVMLAFAVLSGLGAMYGTSKLLSKNQDLPVVEMQDVLVAARDIKVEEVIKPELVKVVRMEKQAVPAGSFSQAKDVEDRWVQFALLEGEPLVERKLAPRGSPPGIMARIPKGMRAFSVEVNEQSGVSGFILPDHRVDVIQVVPDEKGHSDAETVLQDVLVLASGQVFTRPDDRTVQARTVTLAVTPEQMEILVAAKAHGNLTLALRPLDSHEVVPPRKKRKPPEEEKPTQVVVKEPEPPPPPPPPPAPAPPPPPARFVVIYRGNEDVKRIRIDQPSEGVPDAPAVETVPPQN
ncbi:MAG: Flp pilus assembly protein CpaB [Isosphaeraceae bacterium]